MKTLFVPSGDRVLVSHIDVIYPFHVLLSRATIFSIRHDNVIDLMMKITGRIISKTTFGVLMTPLSGQNVIFNV